MAMDPANHDDGGDAEELRLHASPVVRGLFLACGFVAVALGVIGVFLPVLPTTPFLLIAAACFARASPRLYRWLARSRTFGPYLREWRQHRSVPWRAKVFALALMSLSIAVSAIFFVRPVWGKVLLVALGVVTGIWLYRIPSRDAPGAGRLLRR
jgi:uncharacterized membrane protein YbaN (DUF454 family)